MSTPTPLDYLKLKEIISSDAAAIRCIVRLTPAGGDADKVFPPTYEGGSYATEQPRYKDIGENRKEIESYGRVLLDSVQSQANRMEAALQRGFDERKLKFPLIVVDFAKDEARELVSDVGSISALQAPHRIADAILRDSHVLTDDGKPGKQFRHKEPAKASEQGKRLDEARTTNATPLFELCPTALIFGMWDSTGPKGGLGAKFARALVSEIVGCEAIPGKRPSSRIDPLGIEKEAGPLFRTADGGFTIEPENALKAGNKIVLYAKTKKGEDVLYDPESDKGKIPDEGRPSKANHGNVTPSLRNDETKELNPGGFTISHAVQTTVLSLPALRRLRFPIKKNKDGKTELVSSSEINHAAQVTLAALALAAVAWQLREGYDLRSRCLLVPDESPIFQIVSAGKTVAGKTDDYTLSPEEATALLTEASAEAVKKGLAWNVEPLVLVPLENLKLLVLKSRQKTAAVPV